VFSHCDRSVAICLVVDKTLRGCHVVPLRNDKDLEDDESILLLKYY